MNASSILLVLLFVVTGGPARATDVADHGTYLTYTSRRRGDKTVLRLGAETWAGIQGYGYGRAPVPLPTLDLEVFTGAGRLFTPHPFSDAELARLGSSRALTLKFKLDDATEMTVSLTPPYDAEMRATKGRGREALRLAFYSDAFKTDLTTYVVKADEVGSAACAAWLDAEPRAPSEWRILRWAR